METPDKYLSTVVTLIRMFVATIWNIADRSRRQGANSAKLDMVILRQCEIGDHVNIIKTDVVSVKIQLAEHGVEIANLKQTNGWDSK